MQHKVIKENSIVKSQSLRILFQFNLTIDSSKMNKKNIEEKLDSYKLSWRQKMWMWWKSSHVIHNPSVCKIGAGTELSAGVGVVPKIHISLWILSLCNSSSSYRYFSHMSDNAFLQWVFIFVLTTVITNMLSKKFYTTFGFVFRGNNCCPASHLNNLNYHRQGQGTFKFCNEVITNIKKSKKRGQQLIN